jgi:hypothetical protein
MTGMHSKKFFDMRISADKNNLPKAVEQRLTASGINQPQQKKE